MFTLNRGKIEVLAQLTLPRTWPKPSAEVPTWTIYHRANAVQNAAFGSQSQSSTNTKDVKTACATFASRAIPRALLSGSATTATRPKPSADGTSKITASGSTNEPPTISGETWKRCVSGASGDGSDGATGSTRDGASGQRAGSQWSDLRYAADTTNATSRLLKPVAKHGNLTPIADERRNSAGAQEKPTRKATQALNRYGPESNTMAAVAGYAARGMRR